MNLKRRVMVDTESSPYCPDRNLKRFWVKSERRSKITPQTQCTFIDQVGDRFPVP